MVVRGLYYALQKEAIFASTRASNYVLTRLREGCGSEIRAYSCERSLRIKNIATLLSVNFKIE